ncbi:hypothetical protein F4780DRAFT_51897 [Xylariomycetidae sp. FL0641]|nr:hypothetical protein F4780DRAFT_51897 [Xylariomycetidae sp. FL0641]
MLQGGPGALPGYRGGSWQPQVTVVRDHQACIPFTRILSDGDLVLLLTPVVATAQPGLGHHTDPFEPLGRALAARHPWVRHVPYTARNGITSTHVSFIRRAKAVVFVISGPPTAGQKPQAELAEVTRMVGDQRPQILVACQDIRDLGRLEASFPTIIQLPGYMPVHLQSAAAALFGETQPPTSGGIRVQELVATPKFWPPEEWKAMDVSPVHELWNQCLPDQFRLEKFPLQSVLQRDGYAMHFVVRSPETGEIIGFCATYTTFVDKEGERLIGSLAMIIVKSSYRRRGIGLSLHDHALRQLKRIRGVERIQLGSTFPRLLTGVPAGFASESWFRRRGWQWDPRDPSHGQDLCDWLLNIEDWPSGGFSTAPTGLIFRPGTINDGEAISEFIERETTAKNYTGWYDQYTNLANDCRFSDIVLGIERSSIVSSALIYTPHEGSQLALDIPWTRTIGPDVGGVACICIADSNPALTSSRDTVMLRLLDTCICILKEQGMRRVFLDAMKGGSEGFQSMGFSRWATYRDLWKPV